ncbi:MAG: dTMP kinase [Pseudomonadota bacterium]
MSPSDPDGSHKTGRFITFEGGEGTGKTTQIRRLAEHLQSIGIDVVTTREPGGTPEAEAIRGLLLTSENIAWDGAEEVMLVFAARHAHIRSLIAPALARGAWVICDRFTDSTRAYQGFGKGVDGATIDALAAIAQGGLWPDRTLMFDMPVDAALARARGRAEQANRYDLLDAGFHEKVRAGFHAIAQAEPHRVRLIDAAPPPEQVAEAVLDALADLLPPGGHEPA